MLERRSTPTRITTLANQDGRLVVVLDQVIGRMRNSMGMRVATIDACNAEIAQLDAAIGRIAPKQNELKAELEIKAARAAELRRKTRPPAAASKVATRGWRDRTTWPLWLSFSLGAK